MTRSPEQDLPPLYRRVGSEWLGRQSEPSPTSPPEIEESTGRHAAVPDLDMVNHPPHYRCPNPKYDFEAIQVIEAWNLHKEHGLATALAYTLRAPYKGTPSQDARKAAWYLMWWADLYDEEHQSI